MFIKIEEFQQLRNNEKGLLSTIEKLRGFIYVIFHQHDFYTDLDLMYEIADDLYEESGLILEMFDKDPNLWLKEIAEIKKERLIVTEKLKDIIKNDQEATI